MTAAQPRDRGKIRIRTIEQQRNLSQGLQSISQSGLMKGYIDMTFLIDNPLQGTEAVKNKLYIWTVRKPRG